MPSHGTGVASSNRPSDFVRGGQSMENLEAGSRAPFRAAGPPSASSIRSRGAAAAQP